MTTKQRFRNKYVLQVRERDHNPPHVHLCGGGFDVMIDLDTLQATGKWPPSVQAEAMAWVAGHRNELMEEWHKWHK